MLFLDYGDGVADSKLTGPFIERRLGCKGTARNMRSIARIVAKLDEEEKAKWRQPKRTRDRRYGCCASANRCAICSAKSSRVATCMTTCSRDRKSTRLNSR